MIQVLLDVDERTDHHHAECHRRDPGAEADQEHDAGDDLHDRSERRCEPGGRHNPHGEHRSITEMPTSNLSMPCQMKRPPITIRSTSGATGQERLRVEQI